jgi:hypothetical protein
MQSTSQSEDFLFQPEKQTSADEQMREFEAKKGPLA